MKPQYNGAVISFPLPKRDECFFSVVIRYYLLSSNSSFKTTVKTLTGSNEPALFAVVPKIIPHVVKRISKVSSLDEREFIENSTIFPFIRIFITPTNSDKAINNLLNQDKETSFFYLLFGNSKLRGSLRYCQLCAIEDHEQIGYTYWRRSHQLPGVSVCYVHGIGLSHAKETSAKGPLISELLPPIVPRSGRLKIFQSAKDLPEFKHARWCHELVSSGRKAYGPNILHRALKASPVLRGYLRSHNRLSIVELRKDLESSFGYKFLSALGSNLSFTHEQDWLSAWFQKKNMNIINCLLLMEFLFNSPESLFLACDEVQEQKLDSSLHPILPENTLTNVGRTEPLDTKGKPLNDERTMWREKLKHLMQEPNITRKKLRTRKNQAFFWLRQNDSQWLEQMLPKRKPYSNRQKKDLRVIDNKIADRIGSAEAKILNKDDFPIRVTIKALMEELNEPIILRGLKGLPNTSSAVNSALESRENFEDRRLEWAIHHLRTEGRKLTCSSIRRAAHLSSTIKIRKCSKIGVLTFCLNFDKREAV